MSHRLNIDAIYESVFVLLNICYGAEKFARTHDLSTYEKADLINGPFYVGWLKTTLSEKLIDISIKTRVILDLIGKEEERFRKNGEEYAVKTREIDDRITERLTIGHLTPSRSQLTIREAANKIIHASDVILMTDVGEGDHYLDEKSALKREWRYWNGIVELRGENRGENWSLTLYVSEFCRAIHEFVRELEYGADWKSIHYGIDCF